MSLNNTTHSEKGSLITARDSVVRGHAVRLASSGALGWKNILVERYLIDPEEKAETVSDCHIVVMANGKHVGHGERRGWGGHMVPYQKEPGTINVYENGLQPAINPFNLTDLTLCALDRRFVEGVAREFGREANLMQKIGIRDTSIENLINLLANETETGGFLGPSYADHLTYALTIRLLSVESRERQIEQCDHPLPYHRLQRVLRFMEANLEQDLNIAVLAEESGYSRSHFLRMFHTSTGYSPHQYLLLLRLKKAKAMMKDRKATLLNIALSCGFASHAHFTRTFRQVLNVTPSYYRRHI